MQEPTKLWNWKYLVFVGLQTLNYTMFYIACPVIPKYAVSLGLALSIAGILSGGYAIASLVARPVAGYCIDNFERKRIMVGALILCGLSTAALVLTKNWFILLVLRVIYGASFSFFSTMLVSCATDYIPKKNMAEGISYYGLGVALAAAIGPPVGLALSEMIGMKALFVVMGIVCLLSAAVVLFVPVAPKEHSGEKIPFSMSNVIERSVIIFAVLVVPFTFSNGFINSFIALTAEQRHIAGYSMFFTVFAVAMMILKPLSGKMQDKWGLAFVLVPAFILTAAASGLVAIGHTLILLIIAAVFLAFGQGAGQPALLAKCVSCTDEEKRGIAISTYYLGMDFGIGVGIIAGSGIADALGYEGAYSFCGVLLVLGLLLYIAYELKGKRRKNKDEETV